jgi:flagellar motility protein MotE (MotC chaperone)
MENKHILIIIAIVTGTFLVSLMTVVGIYFYDPEILGFPAPKDKVREKEETMLSVDDLPVTETVNITKSRMDFFEKTLIQKQRLESEKDSLLMLEKSLRDSLKKNNEIRKNAIEQKQTAQKKLSDTLKVISTLNDSLRKLNSKYTSNLRKLEKLKQTIKNQELYISQEADSSKFKNFENFANIYNNTDPAEVAGILEQIDERDAANIIKMMSKRKAGKVLEAMSPENAAAILLLGGSK